MPPDDPAAASDDSTEPLSVSFVVRIWLEQPPDMWGTPWRGHVTYVTDGTRHYFDDLERLALIVGTHLEQAGAQLPLRWYLWRWFARRPHDDKMTR